jgi:hypothetical protein
MLYIDSVGLLMAVTNELLGTVYGQPRICMVIFLSSYVKKF